MPSKPTFLIVTPSFNQGHFIVQTIESILSQRYPTEYWVMDAKSSDNTTQILKRYGKKLHWISEKDAGQTDAINKGIKKMRIQGKKLDETSAIFAYINSDDYYLPGAFERVAQAFRQYPKAQWLVGDCQIVDQDNRPIHQPIAVYKRMLRRLYFPKMLSVLNPIPQPAVFVRWSAVEEVGLFEKKLRYVMDYQYWLRLQQRFGPPLMLEQPLAAFRIHGTSKGGTQFARQFDEQYGVAQRFTKDPIFLFLHQLHNWMTKAVYRVIK